MKFFRTARAGKAARLSRIGRSQKLLSVCRMGKIFKIFKLCRFLARTFKRVHQLFYKTLCCLPSIWKMMSVLCALFYIYALIGMEIFNTKQMSEDEAFREEYYRTVLGDFNSFPAA